MKFLKLISINIKYILNKQTFIFLGSSFVIMCIAFLFNTNIFDSKASKILFMEDYYQSYLVNSYNVAIVIFAFFSIFLSLTFTNAYDTYLITRRPKYEIVISKIVSCAIILLLYIYITFALFIIVPCFSLKYFSVNYKIIISFVRIYFNGLFYMLLSSLIIEIFHHYLACFVVLVLFWTMKIITTINVKKGSLLYFINNLFPTLLIDENKLIVKNLNNLIVPFLCVFISIAICLCYIKKSFKQ